MLERPMYDLPDMDAAEDGERESQRNRALEADRDRWRKRAGGWKAYAKEVWRGRYAAEALHHAAEDDKDTIRNYWSKRADTAEAERDALRERLAQAEAISKAHDELLAVNERLWNRITEADRAAALAQAAELERQLASSEELRQSALASLEISEGVRNAAEDRATEAERRIERINQQVVGVSTAASDWKANWGRADVRWRAAEARAEGLAEAERETADAELKRADAIIGMLREELAEAERRGDGWKARSSELSARGAIVGRETGRIIHDLEEKLAADLLRHRAETAEARAADAEQAPADDVAAALRVASDGWKAAEARAEGLAERMERMRVALVELITVADLRGDSTLPKPEDDSCLWTARMQTAWDEVCAALAASAEEGKP